MKIRFVVKTNKVGSKCETVMDLNDLIDNGCIRTIEADPDNIPEGIEKELNAHLEEWCTSVGERYWRIEE